MDTVTITELATTWAALSGALALAIGATIRLRETHGC